MSDFRTPREALKASLESIFKKWTALQLAVEQQFGGDSSEDIAREMFEVSLGLLTSGTAPPSQATLENLFYDGFEYLNTDIEDGSPEEVAGLLLRVRELCLAHDFSLARSLVQSSQTNANAASRSVYGGASEETYGEPEHGQPQALAEEDRQERNAPDVDEDGWQTVKPRRKAADHPHSSS
ncbi:hypothetical protein NDN08_006260 [Rhodosorus marinus]|uniref:Pre-rRNA-processing protein TSR2 homolog n=1 Tax=Rhodosorus marinus TaxID=101924 RepID=A0AAV8UNQ6_9RHOD|nr:hypothetical protein NDN08_006260 [Rhodosorus marinus]